MPLFGRSRLREVMTAARETPSSVTTNTLRSLLDRVPGVDTYTANKWANKGVAALQLGGFGPLAAVDELWAQNQQTAADLKAGRYPSNLNAGAAALAGALPVGKAAGMFGKGAKRLREVMDALPMDTPSRMARAEEMGHTIDAYRGEGEVLDGEGYVLGHGGRVDRGYLGEAIYATNAPRIANSYANQKAMRARVADEAAHVLPLKVRMQNPLIVDTDTKRRLSGLPPSERDAWLRSVQEQGHDGVIVRWGDGMEEYVIPDPSQIRSRFAAFDPAKRNSGNLMAGTLAGMTGFGLLSEQDR